MTIRISCERPVVFRNQPLGIIKGYIAIWGSRFLVDSYKTWFDRERPPEMALDSGMHRRPIMYEHAMDKVIRKEVVGVIDEIFFDEIGIGFIGHLFPSSEFFPKIVSDILARRLKTSSATMENTADWYEDGAFENWILGEMSLTENPAEERMPEVALVRSAAEGERDVRRDGDEPILTEAINPGGSSEPPQRSNLMNLNEMLRDLIAQGASAQDIVGALLQSFTYEEIMAALQQQQAPVPEAAAAGGATAGAATEVPTEMGARSNALNVQQLLAELNRSKAARDQAAELATMRTQMAQLETRLNQQVAAPPVQDTTRHAGNGVGANVNLIETRKYARYDNMEFLAAAEIVRQNKNLHDVVGEGFLRTLAHRQMDFLRSEKDSDDPMISFVRSAYTRADDFMATDITGQGLEWVGVMYGTKIWELARIQPITDALLKRGMMELEVPDGANSVWVPLEGADPTFYTTSQANDSDATNRPEVVVNVEFVGTDRVQVTPGELTGAVGYTDIQAEDSLFDVASQINQQLNKKGPEVIEGLAFNGDTVVTASTNINLIDGTPGTGLSKPYYLASDGILKLPLVTATTLSRDAANAHSEDDYRLTKAKLPDELVANPEGLMFVEDVQTYEKALDIAAIKTLDVAGQNYTLVTGKVTPMYGVEVFRTGRMALANTAGKISATPGNNIRGRIACVYPQYWAMVWKRRISFEQARYPMSKVNVVIASLRIAFRRRSNNAASLSFNVAVS